MVLQNSEAKRRIRRRLSMAAIVVATALVLAWLTEPPERVVLNEGCEPGDVTAVLSAWIHGPRFWASQEVALTDEIKTLQDLRNSARLNPRRPVDMTPIEMRMRRLSDKERAALIAGEEDAWRNEILFFGRCEAVARARLNP